MIIQSTIVKLAREMSVLEDVVRNIEDKKIIRIRTKFLYHSGDNIEIYAMAVTNGILLFDLKETIRELKNSGIEITVEEFEKIAAPIALENGVDIFPHVGLRVISTPRGFSGNVVALLQTIVAVDAVIWANNKTKKGNQT